MNANLKRVIPGVLLALGLESAHAQTLLFRDDFEHGPGNWAMTGVWHVEADTSPCLAPLIPFPSPGHCLWMGSAGSCNFEPSWPGTNIARMVAPVALPAAAPGIVLRYRKHMETELCGWTGVDLSRVQISTDGGATWTANRPECVVPPYSAPWIRRRYDLSAYAGSQLVVGFWFDAMDPYYNGEIGWLIDDVSITTEPGTSFCSAAPGCPCANYYPLGPRVGPDDNPGGCWNSARTEAELFASGTASVAADTLVLRAADLVPGTIALYAQGVTSTSSTFGDGLRCVGGTVIRLAIHAPTSTEDRYPGPGEPAASLQGMLPPAGGTRFYQVVYRDAASFCTSGTFATTNGYSIDWTP